VLKKPINLKSSRHFSHRNTCQMLVWVDAPIVNLFPSSGATKRNEGGSYLVVNECRNFGEFLRSVLGETSLSEWLLEECKSFPPCRQEFQEEIGRWRPNGVVKRRSDAKHIDPGIILNILYKVLFPNGRWKTSHSTPGESS